MHCVRMMFSDILITERMVVVSNTHPSNYRRYGKHTDNHTALSSKHVYVAYIDTKVYSLLQLRTYVCIQLNTLLHMFIHNSETLSPIHTCIYVTLMAQVNNVALKCRTVCVFLISPK